MSQKFVPLKDESFSLYQHSFKELADKIPFSAPFQAIRQKAFSEFSQLGIPTPRHEEWKYTNVASLASIPFQFPLAQKPAFPNRETIERFRLGENFAASLVFVNGIFSEDLSETQKLPKGVQVESLWQLMKSDRSLGLKILEQHLGQHAQTENQSFVSLNTSFLHDGAFVRIPKGEVVDQPISLTFIHTPSNGITNRSEVICPRVFILAEENAQAKIVESYVGDRGKNSYFTSVVREVILENSAILDHFKVQMEGEAATHISHSQIEQGSSSQYSSHCFSFGGKLVRNDINVRLNGAGAECVLNGLYLGGGHQHMDNHTLIDHVHPHCNSHELYKGILGGHARGVFNGKIIVRPDAQKTNAIQSNKTLLLSKNASIDTKPQLEIFADDVKCTHGATIGQIDEDALFYLRARGIGLEDAYHILIQAFANEIVDKNPLDDLKQRLHRLLVEKLRAIQSSS